MPINEYGCSKCENVWEVTVLKELDEPTACPECGATNFHKYISWRGMYSGEHKRAWDRPPPGNSTSVVVSSNIKKTGDKE